jgi:hypothetical protein
LKGIPGEDKAFKSVLINQENLPQVNDLTAKLGANIAGGIGTGIFENAYKGLPFMSKLLP